MSRFKWNKDLEEELKEIFYLYTNKEISIYFDNFKELSDEKIMKKGNDLKLHKSEFIIRGQGNSLPIDFNERYNIYMRYMNTEDGNKLCLHCYRELKDNADYFFIRNSKTISTCKECGGHKFTNKLTHIPKQGYKFCIKCDKELPINIEYFPPDEGCKDSFRNVCRCCGKDGHYMEEGYIPKEWWSRENEELFLKIYPNYTNYEIMQLFFPNETRKSLDDKAFRMGKINKSKETMDRVKEELSKNYSGENNWNYGKPKSEDTKRKLSEAKKGKYLGKDNWNYGKHWAVEHRQKLSVYRKKIGQWSGDKNPRHIKPLNGELNGRWLGGVKELYYDLRDHLQYWKRLSMENCNYKCILTGYEFDEIHHLVSFRNIIKEIFSELNLDMRSTIGDYSIEQRDLIYKSLYDIHNKYPLGVCLCKEIHKTFHDTYGYFNTTIEMFEEFKDKYYNGDFDYLLSDKMTSIKINKKMYKEVV